MQSQSIQTSDMFPNGQATCFRDQSHHMQHAKLQTSAGFPLKRAQSPLPQANYYCRPLTPCTVPLGCTRNAFSSIPHRPVSTGSWSGTRNGVGVKPSEPFRPLSAGLRYCTAPPSSGIGQARVKEATVPPVQRSFPVWVHAQPTQLRYASPLQRQNGYHHQTANPSAISRIGATADQKGSCSSYGPTHERITSPTGESESAIAANVVHQRLLMGQTQFDQQKTGRTASGQPHVCHGRSRPLVPLFAGFQFPQPPPVVVGPNMKLPHASQEQMEEQGRRKRPASAPPSFVSRFWAFLNGSDQITSDDSTFETATNIQKSVATKSPSRVSVVQPSQTRAASVDLAQSRQNHQRAVNPCSGGATCIRSMSSVSQSTGTYSQNHSARQSPLPLHASSPQAERHPAADSPHLCRKLGTASFGKAEQGSLRDQTSNCIQQQCEAPVGNEANAALSGMAAQPCPSPKVQKGFVGGMKNEAELPFSHPGTQQRLLKHYQEAILQHRQRLLAQQQTIQQYEEMFKRQQADLEFKTDVLCDEGNGSLQKHLPESEQEVLPYEGHAEKHAKLDGSSGYLPAAPAETKQKDSCSTKITAHAEQVSVAEPEADSSDDSALVSPSKPDMETLSEKSDASTEEIMNVQQESVEGSQNEVPLVNAVQPSLPSDNIPGNHIFLNRSASQEQAHIPRAGEVNTPNKDVALSAPHDTSTDIILPKTTGVRCDEVKGYMQLSCDSASEPKEEGNIFGGVHFENDVQTPQKEVIPINLAQIPTKPNKSSQDYLNHHPVDSVKGRPENLEPVLTQTGEKREQFDVIPVAPLIEAVNTAEEWSTFWGYPEPGSTKTVNNTIIDIFLPIQSMVEFESLDGSQHGLEALKSKENIVGSGTYGVVRKLRHRLGGFVVAVKSIRKDAVVQAGMVGQVEFELWVQRDLLRHPNVLRCLACVEDADCLHIILDYCEKGDLYKRIREQPNRRFEEFDAFCLFAQLLNGLNCVHRSGVIHRDLKLENLLLARGNILKIADFGWCESIVGKSRSFGFCGTLDYLAPEMIKGQGHDWRVDMWSLGVLLYEFLDGRPPFESTRHLELVQRIITVDLSMPKHIASDAADLIRGLLQYDPNKRLSHKEVGEHPWVQRMWRELYSRALKCNPSIKWSLFEVSEAPVHSSRRVDRSPRCIVPGRKQSTEINITPINMAPSTDFGISTVHSRQIRSALGKQSTEQERRPMSPSKGTRQTDALANTAKRYTATDQRSSKLVLVTDGGTTAIKRQFTPQANRILVKHRPGRGRSSNNNNAKGERDRLPQVDLNRNLCFGSEGLNPAKTMTGKLNITPDRGRQSSTRGTGKVPDFSVEVPIRQNATSLKEAVSKTVSCEGLHRNASPQIGMKPGYMLQQQNACSLKQQGTVGLASKWKSVSHGEIKDDSDAMTCLRSVRKVRRESRNVEAKSSGEVSKLGPCSQTSLNRTGFQGVRTITSQAPGETLTHARNSGAVKGSGSGGHWSSTTRLRSNSHDSYLPQQYSPSIHQYPHVPQGLKTSRYQSRLQPQGCVVRQQTGGQSRPLTPYTVCGSPWAGIKREGQSCNKREVNQTLTTSVPLREAGTLRSKLCVASQPPAASPALRSLLKHPAAEHCRDGPSSRRIPLVVAGFPGVVEPKFLSNPAALFG